MDAKHDRAALEALGWHAARWIERRARRDAAEYVRRHGHAYDDARTLDADSGAWYAAESVLEEDYGGRMRRANAAAGRHFCWEMYAQVFYAETRRLADAGGHHGQGR